MSHTPGPWTLADPSYMAEGVEYVMAGTNEEGWQPEIAVIYGDENQKSNALLIAAAPELLAAAQMIIETCPCDNDLTMEFNAAWHLLIDAVKLAGGE